MNTLKFVLRWEAPSFLGGIALAAWAAYSLLTFVPDQPSQAFEAAVSIFGRPTYITGLLIGLALTVRAWWKGARVASGR